MNVFVLCWQWRFGYINRYTITFRFSSFSNFTFACSCAISYFLSLLHSSVLSFGSFHFIYLIRSFCWSVSVLATLVHSQFFCFLCQCLCEPSGFFSSSFHFSVCVCVFAVAVVVISSVCVSHSYVIQCKQQTGMETLILKYYAKDAKYNANWKK